MEEARPLTLLPTSIRYESNKILVVEDEESVSKFIRYALEPRNEIVAVADGVEGVRQIQKSEFDVIICDMMMPNLPGDMFYSAVQRIKPHLCNRFIFMTGYRNDEKIAEFINTINGLMLYKPFKPRDLLDMIAFVQVRTHLANWGV